YCVRYTIVQGTSVQPFPVFVSTSVRGTAPAWSICRILPGAPDCAADRTAGATGASSSKSYQIHHPSWTSRTILRFQFSHLACCTVIN
ncbi:hypothetical protein DPEC_G00231460, partial [Dallia pectoralis]